MSHFFPDELNREQAGEVIVFVDDLIVRISALVKGRDPRVAAMALGVLIDVIIERELESQGIADDVSLRAKLLGSTLGSAGEYRRAYEAQRGRLLE